MDTENNKHTKLGVGMFDAWPNVDIQTIVELFGIGVGIATILGVWIRSRRRASPNIVSGSTYRSDHEAVPGTDRRK